MISLVFNSFDLKVKNHWGSIPGRSVYEDKNMAANHEMKPKKKIRQHKGTQWEMRNWLLLLKRELDGGTRL